jgi:hypothetical protein
VTRSYRRDPRQTHPEWPELTCSADTTHVQTHVQIGSEYYALSPDGLLMPVRKGQKPPDLEYFK